MKEPKLNEVFEFEGKTLKCIEGACEDCDSLSCGMIKCGAVSRLDGKQVIFIDVSQESCKCCKMFKKEMMSIPTDDILTVVECNYCMACGRKLKEGGDE